jgi:hypothetical protein
MARPGRNFLRSVVVNADQFVMPQLSMVPNRSLLFEELKSVVFERSDQFAKPQSFYTTLLQSTARPPGLGEGEQRLQRRTVYVVEPLTP